MSGGTSSTPPAPPPPLLGGGNDDQAVVEDETAAAKQPQIAEDGYQWNKYGQKPIKNIDMIRSYYKCRSKNCRARKRVEWRPSNPSNRRTIYDGDDHNHAPLPPPLPLPNSIDHPHHQQQRRRQEEEDANFSLQYELGNQVLGRRRRHP